MLMSRFSSLVKRLLPTPLINILIKIIVVTNTIKKKISRVIRFKLSGKKKILCKYPISVISHGFHSSCGYYDFNPILDGKLAFFSTDRKYKTASNYLFDIDSGKTTLIGNSKLVNWQQGNRLRWIKKSKLIYNDFINDHYVSIEDDVGKSLIHYLPVYDSRENVAISIDFNRLGYLRPGYGYTKFPFEKGITENSIAITIFDLNNDSIIRQIKYGDIVKAFDRKFNLDKCYVNHICISRSPNTFLFFFIEIIEKNHQCNLCLYNNGTISIIEDELSASHYAWKNEYEILFTAYNKNNECGYYLYNTHTGKKERILPDILIRDGHPTFIDDNVFISDTYPDDEGFQTVFMVDQCVKKIDVLASIYSTSKHIGVKRCDLHPRYDSESGSVILDADIDGKRRIYIIKPYTKP